MFHQVEKIKDHLAHGEMDPSVCRETLDYIESLERKYEAACKVADQHRAEFLSAIDGQGMQ